MGRKKKFICFFPGKKKSPVFDRTRAGLQEELDQPPIPDSSSGNRL